MTHVKQHHQIWLRESVQHGNKFLLTSGNEKTSSLGTLWRQTGWSSADGRWEGLWTRYVRRKSVRQGCGVCNQRDNGSGGTSQDGVGGLASLQCDSDRSTSCSAQLRNRGGFRVRDPEADGFAEVKVQCRPRPKKARHPATGATRHFSSRIRTSSHS